MSAEFVIPDWMPRAAPPTPPDLSVIDLHRVEDLVNRFIAAKQDALFTGPDAYFQSEGREAVQLLPFIKDRLAGLKADQLAEILPDHPQARAGISPESLIQPLTEGERAVLGERLDAHIADAMDAIDRHVPLQRDVFNRQTIAERQRLIQTAATLEHTNDEKLAGLAEANAGAARELARMLGQPEDPAMADARATVWQSAIAQRLANGDPAGAIELFRRKRRQLSDSHVLSLDTPLQVGQQDETAERWIGNQTGTDGPPLRERLAADPNLPLEIKCAIRAKRDERESAAESKRTATVQALDDEVQAAQGTLATHPGAYKTGTFAKAADAYAAAGEPDKAQTLRRLALQESTLISFARTSADRQQAMIDELGDGLAPRGIAAGHARERRFSGCATVRVDDARNDVRRAG